jgi:molecular chaperone GrpE
MTNPMDDRPELAEKLSELEILRQSLEQVKSKEKDLFDQLLRLNAEYQNFRKRSEARITEARKAGREDVLLGIITLADAMAQAELASAHASDVSALKKGLKLIKDQFDKFLADQGLVAIKAAGEKMDPHLHEAIAQVFDANLPEGTIVDEIQRGYTMNGQIVRPARVRVAAKSHEEVAGSQSKEDQNHV